MKIASITPVAPVTSIASIAVAIALVCAVAACRPPEAATTQRTNERASRAAASPPGPRFRTAYPDLHRELLRRERELVRIPTTYAQRHAPAPTEGAGFRPAGLYLEPGTDTLWVWSRDHRLQRGYTRAGKRWRAAGTRVGPADTRRCQALTDTPLTLCVGLHEPRGLVAYGAAEFSSGLPARGGFRDLAVVEARERVYVIDAYLDVLWTLDLDGAVRGRVALVPGSYRLGAIGRGHLFVLSSNQPRLSIIPLEEEGMPGAPVGLELTAPPRDAAYDHATDTLWTSGYREEQVRRYRGYVENLESFVYGYRAADLIQGRLAPTTSINLAEAGLSDPVAVHPTPTALLVAVSGSHCLARVEPGPGQVTEVEAAPSALVPQAVVTGDGYIAVAGLLDDRVHIHDPCDLARVQTLTLNDDDAASTLPPEPYRVGELLFYSKALWADTARNRFTCNSCHWDGLVDHRVHPGLQESRWEQIRPAAGVGMLTPVFTPGQGRTLTGVIDGFIRGLDERYWHTPEVGVWLDDVALEVAPGQRVALAPFDVRLGLLTFLARRPVEPGYLRAPGRPLSDSARRGAELFWRDCARCHEPRARMGTGPILDLASGLAYLGERPLAFGGARMELTGVEPSFTKAGNRISPLTQLSRGGPFYSDGSAPTLVDAVRRSDPKKALVHAPDNARQPFYSPTDTRALVDFLLSI
ncbi:hypothetical protein [Haliangium sp.]|uniref:hypothetical protein n=1 Tax=Haliangium sp. TaxID=2663208 RepID=UPI003D14302F